MFDKILGGVKSHWYPDGGIYLFGDLTNVRIMEPTSAKILPQKYPDFAPTYENFTPNLSGQHHIPMGGLSGVLGD
jgi:hypothetical protein